MALSEPQLKAIRFYTGVGYREINGDLRGDASGDPEVFAAIYHLDAAIEAAPRTGRPLELYRGVDEAYATELERRDLRAGDMLIDKAFLSTSLDPKRAHPFTWPGEGLVMNIHLPAGGKALDLTPYSANPEEHEYLLPGETRLRVLGYDADAEMLELEVVADG